MKPLDRLLYLIQERESIRLKRAQGLPAPWTKDKILQSYRFCNVRRMDDKVSQWLLTNWFKPCFDHKNMVIACCLARFINDPFSLSDVRFPLEWNPEQIKHRLRKRRDDGYRVFNPAYMIRGNDGIDKIESVIDYTIQPLVDDPPEIVRSSMEETWSNLTQYHGFGSFMAGQVVADLRWAMEGTWKDKHTWAPVGPGSQRGMNVLQGRDPYKSLSQNQFLDELRELAVVIKTRLPKIMARLELHDIQNCCCEYWKYSKVVMGMGTPKQRYNGV